MEARLQRRVQRYGWDKAATHYERFWREQLAPAQEKLIELAAPQVGQRILDVACGTGLVTIPLARSVGPSGAVVATDLADAMVAAVAAEAARLGLHQITARRMDAEALDFPDQSFDAAVCALGLMYVPDAAQALREMARVVRPGGRVVAAVWGRRDRCGWAEIFPIVDRRVASEVCPMFFQLGTGETLGVTMRRAGLADVDVVRLASVLRYASAEEAVGAAFAGGPVALAYSRFDEGMRNDAHEEYLQSIEPWRTGDGYEVPGEFVVASGVAPGLT
jgi:ubiquinone/menaquinone biosynthesis C-methylase UbiE